MKYTKDDLAFLKRKNTKQQTTSQSLKGKICVISGATSGVGLEALKKLAGAGADLVMLCRNQKKAEEIRTALLKDNDMKIDIVKADFSSLSEVRQAAQTILERYQVIDVLINSAGLYSTQRKTTQDGNELVFGVNHLAPFLLTVLLLPLLKKSAQGRVIQVNSEGHRFGGLDVEDLDWKKRHYFGLRSYGASKTAQIMGVMRMAEKLKNTSVTVNAMHPGGVKTNIGQNNGLLYRTWQRAVIRHFLKDPAISGAALYYLAAAPELDKTSGKYFFLTNEEKPMQTAQDEKVRAAIWEKSLRLTGLDDSKIG